MNKIRINAFIIIMAMLMSMQVFADDFGLTAEINNGIVTISWNGDGSESYSIIRDGEYITDVSENKYTDTTTEVNTAYEYSVMSENGYSESITVVVDNDYYAEQAMLFASEFQSGFKAIDTEKYSETSVSDKYKLFGKESLCWKFKDKQPGIKKEMYILNGDEKQTFNVLSLKDYGLFGFWIYIDADNYKNDLQLFLADKYGNTSKYHTVAAKAKQWKFIPIYLNQIGKEKFDFGSIVSADFIKTNKETKQFDIYIQKMGFYGVNENMLAFGAAQRSDRTVELTFTKAVNKDTVSKDSFACDNGLKISDCNVSEDGRSCVITFDKPIINGEIYKLTANSGITGANGEVIGEKSNFASFGTYAYNGKTTFAEETAAFAAGAAVFYNGNTSAIIRGMHMNGADAAYISDGKAYVPSKLINAAFGTNLEENGLVSADSVLTNGLQLYIKRNLIVIADTNPDDAAAEELKNALNYQWGNLHLGTEGFVTGIISHPKDPELMYARTDVGGAYRYDKVNKKWIPMLDIIPHSDTWLMGVSGIAADPNDTNTIYAACGTYDYVYPHDILKSTDGGNTWNRLYFSKYTLSEGDHRYSGENIAVDPNNSDNVYVGTYSDGLWKSTDGGKNWQAVSDIPRGTTTPSGGVRILYFDENGVLYAGVCGNGVYKSTDGTSFVKLEGSPKNPIRMTSENGILYVSASSRRTSDIGGLYKYDGNEWTDISPTFSKSKSEHSVGAFVVKGDFILAAGAPYTDNLAYFARSYDGGQTWENCGFVRGENNIWSNPSAMIWSDAEKNDVILATGAGIHKMENVADGTLYPKYFEDGAEELVCFDVMSVPSEEAPMYQVGCMDKGYVSGDNPTDRGISHESFILEVCSLDFCEEQPKFEVQAGNDENNNGIVMFSENFGRKWTEKAWNGGIIHDIAVAAKVGTNGYPMVIAAASDGIWRSADFGQSWEKLSTDIVTDTSKNMSKEYLKSDRVNENVFYYSEYGKLYVSKDEGETWKYLREFNIPADTAANDDNAMVRNYFVTAPYIEGTIWFNTLDGIYTSNDFGETWNVLQGIENTKTFGFGKGKELLPAVYAVGTVNSVYGIYISDDLGENWRRIDGGFNIPCTMYQMTGDRREYGRVFVATGGRGVFYGAKLSEGIDSIKLNAENDVLSWDTAEYADKYVVLRNGEKIAETTGTTYTDTSAPKESTCEYMVRAESNGEIIAASNTVWVFYDDKSKAEAVSVYKNREKSTGISIASSWGREPDYVTDKTIIGGTALKFNMRANAGPNELYFKQIESTEKDENGKVTAEIFKTYDLSGLKETGYLRMLVYPETELADFAGAVNLVLYDGDRANKDSKQSNIVSVKDQLTFNKWNLVKVPVASFANDSIDLSKTSRVLFQFAGNYAENSLSYYIQNVGFCDEAGLNISTAECTNGSVNLSWTQKTIKPAQYSVKCNGEEIAKTAETAYSYVPSQKDCINEYTVDALDGNGTVICTSDAKILFIDNPKTITVAGVYENSVQPNEPVIWTVPNYGYPAYTDENTIIGGKALRFGVKSAEYIRNHKWFDGKGNPLPNELKIEYKGEPIDASAAEYGGYLTMLIYPKTELESLPGNISVYYHSGNSHTNIISISEQLTMNKWNFVKVPVETLIKDRDAGLDSSKINQVFLRADGEYQNENDLVLYVQNIEFSKTEGIFANEIKAEENGNKVTFSANVRNLTSEDAVPVMIAAAYNKDGSLAKVEMFNTTAVGANSEGIVSETFELPENTTYKAMLVSDISSMKPLTKAAERR